MTTMRGSVLEMPANDLGEQHVDALRHGSDDSGINGTSTICQGDKRVEIVLQKSELVMAVTAAGTGEQRSLSCKALALGSTAEMPRICTNHASTCPIVVDAIAFSSVVPRWAILGQGDQACFHLVTGGKVG